jgi:hypothetical protein
MMVMEDTKLYQIRSLLLRIYKIIRGLYKVRQMKLVISAAQETVNTFPAEQMIEDPLELIYFDELTEEEQYYYIVEFYKEEEELKGLDDMLLQLDLEEEDWMADAMEYKESDEGKDLCELMDDSY